jgi:hypothetical protein
MELNISQPTPPQSCLTEEAATLSPQSRIPNLRRDSDTKKPLIIVPVSGFNAKGINPELLPN